MAGRINTNAVLNNGWNCGNNDQVFTGTIAVHPDVEKSYDFALTSDPVLLQERQQAQENLYDIFKNSPYFEKYGGIVPDSSIPFSKKVERSDIIPVFYYMKEELEKRQQLNVSEMIMQINEFFDFNYDYIVNTVLSVPLRAKLFTEVYKDGHRKIIDETEALF